MRFRRPHPSRLATLCAAATLLPALAFAQANLPFVEDFDAATTASLTTPGYRALPGIEPPLEMFHRLAGTAAVVDGAVALTGARLSIGNTTPAVTTTAGSGFTGIFGLGSVWTVSMCVRSAALADPLVEKKFQVYVDNNSTGQANSPHGGPSRLLNLDISTLQPNSVVSVTSSLGSANSFVALRTETG